MYRHISHKINDNQTKYYFTVDNNNQNCKGFDEISYAEFINLLKSKNNDFLKVFYESLNDATDKLSAYFWECIPTSQKSINKKFEFVVTKSEALNNITQDSKPFAEHLAKLDAYKDSFVSFPNKNKDAVLVIPASITRKWESGGKTEMFDYKNISQFTKNAPLKQQSKFWQEVANRLSEKLEDGATHWLSTHGLGVPYLHVRIDNQPKYYSFEEYKTQQEDNAKDENIEKNKADIVPQQKAVNDLSKPIKEESLDNKQDDNKDLLPSKNDNNNSDELKEKTLQNLDETGFNQEHLANSSSIEQENTEKANSQKNKLLLIGGIGAILVIGIGLVIWWKWKKDKTNQK
jgi:hypothetical protein